MIRCSIPRLFLSTLCLFLILSLVSYKFISLLHAEEVSMSELFVGPLPTPAINLANLTTLCSKYNIDLEQPEHLPLELIASYFQQEYKLVDPLGDHALAITSMSMPKKLWYTLTKRGDQLEELYWKHYREAEICGKPLFNFGHYSFAFNYEADHWAPSENELQTLENLIFPDSISAEVQNAQRALLKKDLIDGRLYLEGKQNPLKIKNFKKMMLQILAQEYQINGITPTFGEVHSWSPGFRENFNVRYFPILEASKLLVALARGMTAQYLITGQEVALKNYILSQPPFSIRFHEIFRQSYRLNQGNIYLTLLTVENLISQHWKDPQRNLFAITRRLSPLINAFGRNADNFGAWYHLFGMMLYGFVKGPVKAKFIGQTESFGSHILSKFNSEKQEDYINKSGGSLGHSLRVMIEKQLYGTEEINNEFLDSNFYLDLNENFDKRLIQYVGKNFQ